eukprot:jgi/Ulvmu1/1113/UM106_0030.1
MASGHQTKNPPSSTVYVRNLPYDITEDEVRSFFLPAGTPSRIAFNNDRETGRFRGIAFVTFPSVDVAESVVRNLNAQNLKGRDIYLDFSRDRERRPGPPRGGQDSHHPPHPQDVHGPSGGSGGGGGYGAPPQMHHNSQPTGYSVPSAPPMQYPGLVSAPPGQPQVGPGQLVFQGNVPNFPGQGQMLQPIILSADGKVISGQAPPGGLLLQGHGAAPMNVPGMPSGAAMPGAAPAPQPALLPPQVMGGGTGGGMPPGAPPPPQQPRNDGGGMGGMPHPQAQAAAAAAAAPKEPADLKPDLPIGIATAQHASQKMANMLGAPQSAAAPSQQTTSSALSGMSPNQLFRILRDLRALIQENPDKGRAVLRENLPLTKALFQAQILLGMVNPDQNSLGEVWAQSNGAAAPALAGMGTHGVGHANGAGDASAPVATAAPAAVGAVPMQQGGGGVPPPPPPQPHTVVKQEPVAAEATAVSDGQRDMVRRVMALAPEQLANLTEPQRQQVEQVKAWALANNITAD